MGKKCFTIVHCDYYGHCTHARADYREGYFNPPNVGEFCPHYIKVAADAPDDLEDRLFRMAGCGE